MFGLEDAGIYMAYVLTILSTLVCIVYGILYWNKGAENEAQEIQEELNWEKEESKISENL